MERKKSDAERARRSRQKQKALLDKYKAFYTFALQKNPEMVTAFEKQEADSGEVFEASQTISRQHTLEPKHNYVTESREDGYRSLIADLWAMKASI